MAELKTIETGVEEELDVEIKEVPKLPKVVPMRHFYKFIDKTKRNNNVTLEPEEESEEQKAHNKLRDRVFNEHEKTYLNVS
jgi:hypothetical protein